MSWLGTLSDFGTAPLAVNIYWESYPGKKAHIWRLWGQTGWMRVSRVTLETPISSYADTITCFCDDLGRPIEAWLGNRLFDMRASVPSYMHHEPPEELADQSDALYWDFLGRCDGIGLRELAEAESRLESEIEAVEVKAERGLRDIDGFIANLLRERRHPDCDAIRREQIAERITAMETMKPKLIGSIAPAREALRAQHEIYERDVYDSLTHHGRIEELHTVRWTMRSRVQPATVNISLWTEDRFAGNLNVGTAWKAQIGASYDGPARKLRSKPQIRKKSVERKSLHQSVRESATSVIASKVGARPSPNKRAPLTLKKQPQQTVKPGRSEESPSGTSVALAKSKRRKAKREVRSQLSVILKKHGTLSELKYVRAFLRGKTGEDLKMALIHLAKHDFMSTNDAVYLFKVLSALKPKKSN